MIRIVGRHDRGREGGAVRGHGFVEQRRFFGLFGVALEHRLAEGALTAACPVRTHSR